MFIRETRDDPMTYVHQELGRLLSRYQEASIANFPSGEKGQRPRPMKKALDIDVRPNWSYRVIVTLSFSS